MKRTLGGLLLALVSLVGRGSAQGASTDCTADTQGVYGYNFTMVDETTIANLGEEYTGKVLLVVNVATY